MNRFPLMLVAALATSSTLTACVTPPSVEPVVTPVDAQPLGLAGAEVTPASEHWWTAYGDPQLDRLIERALASNPGLDDALARLRAAQAQQLAAGAALKPQVDLDATATRERLSENYTYPDPYAGSMRWFADARLGLSWALDFWGRQAALVQQADAREHMITLAYGTARQVLAGAVVQAYFDLYRAQQLIDIAKASETQRQSLLELTQARLDAGLDTDLELRNAEGLLPQARQSRLEAEALRERAIHELAALCGGGAELYAGIAPAAPAIDSALPVPDALPINLLARRPDILAARAQIDAADAGRAAARAAFYPDISLSAFAGFQSVGLDELFKGGSAVYGAGPVLHLPIFDARRLDANYRAATAGLDSAIAQYNLAVVTAVRQAADQLSNRDSLLNQRNEATQSLSAAEAAFKLAQLRYRAGLTNQLVVLDAESRVLDARRNVLGIDVDLANARVGLLLAVGGSFDPDNLPPQA